jgi:hypothetical protein
MRFTDLMAGYAKRHRRLTANQGIASNRLRPRRRRSASVKANLTMAAAPCH